MSTPLTIEFIGLSGSGKSTTARRLIEDLRAQGMRSPTQPELGAIKAFAGLGPGFAVENRQPISRSRRLVRWIRGALEHPLVTFRVVTLGAATLPRLRFLGRASLGVLKEALVLRFCEQIGAFDIIVFDQAVVQQILSSGLERSVPEWRLFGLLRGIYRSLNVAFVLHKIEPQLAVSRFEGEPRRFLFDFRFTNKDEYYRAAERDLQEHESFLDRLLHEDFCSGRILVVDATEPVEKKVQMIHEFIAKMRSPVAR